MAVDLALTPDRRWRASPVQAVTAASRAGFVSLGISGSHASPEVRDLYDATGLTCHEVQALWITADDHRTIAAATRLAEAASVMAADWVVTVFDVVPDSETVRLLVRCADIVASAGARLAIEFTPMTPVTSIAEAYSWVDFLGVERAGVLIDTWHFLRGSKSWRELETIPLDCIAYVQFSDALPMIADDPVGETMDRRVFPGDGEFELERFATILLERGWAGIVSVEVLSSTLSSLPISDFARKAFAATLAYWQ